MHKLIGLLTLICFSLSSCCTLSRTRTQPVCISSEPAGAAINIDGYPCGTTPQTFALERNISHSIVVEKTGYPTQRRLLPSKTSYKLASNAMIPVVLAVVGAGVGLVATGGCIAGLDGAVVAITAMGGLIAGTAVGALGTGVDLCTGAGRELPQNQVHFNLDSVPMQ